MDQIIKYCKFCNCSSNDFKFDGRSCIKCRSKNNNARIKLKDPDYFKNTMKERYIKRERPIGRPLGSKNKKNTLEILE